MTLRRLCLSALTFCLALAPIAFAQAISLTVDTTHSPEKMLHVREVIPVHAGPLTLYYPKWIPGEHGPDGPLVALNGLHFSAGDKEIPWQRDLLDVYTFHVDIPPGVTQLNAAYDFIEPAGFSATDKLLVLEWNEVALYPAGTPSKDLIYNASLILPDGWQFGTSLPIDTQSANHVSFKPISFDLLVDSPGPIVEIGGPTLYTVVDGNTYGAHLFWKSGPIHQA